MGPDGTFSSEAAESYLNRINRKASLKYYNTLDDCFLGLRLGEIERIIVPLVNSTIGYIPETVRNLVGFNILDIEILQVNLHLVGNGNLEEITQIHTRMEAAKQCRKELSKFNVKIVYENSTSVAAASVVGYANRAAIVSKKASEIYNLKILKRKIQDIQENTTEFVIVGRYGPEGI